MDYPKRIEEILAALNTNQTGLAKKLNVSRGIVSEFASGAREPSKDFLIGLSKLGISIDWFLTGEGNMYHRVTFESEGETSILSDLPVVEEPPQPGPLGIPIIKGGLSEGTRAVIESGIPPDEMSGARLEGAHSLEMNGPAMGEELVYVDFYSSQTAGAGPAREVEAYQSTTPQAILLKFINPWRPDQVKALEVRGDSMTKIGLFDRDIVLFVPTEREGDGVFVISIESRLQVKRLEFDLLGQTLRIISENERYEPRVLTSEEEISRVRIEGKVVGWLHRHPY